MFKIMLYPANGIKPNIGQIHEFLKNRCRHQNELLKGIQTRLISLTSTSCSQSRNPFESKPFVKQTAELLKNDPQEQTNTWALRSAVIGCPNVGKSALTNALVRSPVCAVSKLIDTTRANTMTALTEDECQLIVVDSPGLVSLSHAKQTIGTHTEDRVLTHPEKAIERAEQIIVVQNATARGEFLQHRVLFMLHRYSHIPSCLVLNKIDLIEQRSDLLPLTEILTEGMIGGKPLQKGKPVRMGILSSIIDKARKERGEDNHGDLSLRPTSNEIQRDEKWHALYNKLLHRPAHKASWSDTYKLFKDQIGWPYFDAIFHVSAKTGEGVDQLRDYLRQNAIERKWVYGADLIAKKDPKLLCCEHVRSTLMNLLPGFIAYKLRVGIAEWEVDERRSDLTLRVAINVFCEKASSARRVWYCSEEVEQTQSENLKQLFGRPVLFRLLIRINGVRGVYQGDEVSSQWKIKKLEEARKSAKTNNKTDEDNEEHEQQKINR